jgi:hypothetical protein
LTHHAILTVKDEKRIFSWHYSNTDIYYWFSNHTSCVLTLSGSYETLIARRWCKVMTIHRIFAPLERS